MRDTLDTDEQAVVNANLPAGTDSQSIHFMHDGELPGTATVEVPLTESGLNADDLALYYINEKTNSLELVNTDVNVEKQADGTSVLSFDIEHCSSYIVAPKQSIPTKPATEDTTSSSSKGTTSSPAATPSAPAASGDCTAYYVCSACGYHNWTATENGYRCDHCGYLESVKQLSGYGNVKGVYTPKAGSTPASGSAASAVVPATSDESHPMVWVVLLVVAGGAFVGLLIYKKRQK